MSAPEMITGPAHITPLKQSQVRLRESVCNHWRACVPRGTKREHLTLSDLWSAAAGGSGFGGFREFDEITVVAADRSFYARLLVLDAGKGYASVIELEYHELPQLVVAYGALPAGYDIRYNGPDTLYAVIRLKDALVMKDGFANADEARDYLLTHATLR